MVKVIKIQNQKGEFINSDMDIDVAIMNFHTQGPTKFTHILSKEAGWLPVKDYIEYDETVKRQDLKIQYLGRCLFDGDMFALKTETRLEIVKGNLRCGVFIQKT